MNIFLACLLNGLYKEYKWLYSEYKINWSNPKKHTELTPKEIKIIINKYQSDLHNNSTRKLVFKRVKKIQSILDTRLKKYQSETYNEFNRYGNLKEYRFYQFVVAYKKALENYYKDVVFD